MRYIGLRLALASLFAAGLIAGSAAHAQDAGPDAGQDFHQTVARVSFVQGEGSFQRGDDLGHWQALSLNLPMTIGDRVWTGNGGRIELQAPGLRTFLAPGTELTALNLTEDVQQYSIAEGTATFRLSSMDDDDAFEIDTPSAAVTLERTGLYRVSVDANGNTRVSVRRGSARVAAGGGEVTLGSGELMVVSGLDDPEYDVYALPLADSWDRWVDSRERRRHEIVSYDYTSADVVGAEDLDAFGTWEDVPEYGHVWQPTSVSADWAPYREGRWIWQDPWGWTWVSDEPWGWAPYHYGRWVVVGSRWCWVPVGRGVVHVSYAPALVAFVGGGPGWRVGIGGGGYVGWFPLAPRDAFVPWWGRGSGRPEGRANVTYANRAYATVVQRSVFGDARGVRGAWVRDERIVRDVARAPVLRGPLPVLPTRESLRGAPADRAVSRPPEGVSVRPVAARLAPPPAPPSFARKLELIRENGGSPLTPAASAALTVQSREGARAAAVIRPVMREDRRVDLAPRRGAEGAPPPDPIRTGSRTIATSETPLIAHPSAARESVAAPRVAPGALVISPVKEYALPSSEERARRIGAARGSSPVSAPAPRSVAAPQPAPAAAEPAIERREFSRAPRRVAEPGPDPLVRAEPRAVERPAEKPAERREAPKREERKD